MANPFRCECCFTRCDCGCVCECPRHGVSDALPRAHEIVRAEQARQIEAGVQWAPKAGE